jgi:NitT/TauT family transport system substrate-binding protein
MSEEKRSIWLSIGIVIAVIAVIAGLTVWMQCGREKPVTEVVTISVAEGMAPAAAPLFVADAKGFWANNAIKANPQAFLSGKLCLDAVLGGKAEVGTVAETPLVHAGMQNQDFRIICTFMASDTSVKGIARKDAGISTPKDLKGKKVGTLFGTSAEFFMQLFLEANGLSRDEVKAANLRPPDMVAAIQRGDVDACFIWEPHIHNMKTLLGDNGLILPNDGLYTETFNLVALPDYVEENPEVIERILRTMLEAEDFIQANRADAIKIVSEKLALDVPKLESIWNGYDFQIALTPTLVEFMQKQGRWAKEMGSVPAAAKVPDYTTFLHTSTLKKLMPDRVKVQ